MNRFYFPAMEIESIPFDTFASLTNCPHALGDRDNHGCQWYATRDRSIAGRIYLDPAAEGFRYSVLRLIENRWKVIESPQTFPAFEETEVSLRSAMRRETGKEVV